MGPGHLPDLAFPDAFRQRKDTIDRNDRQLRIPAVRCVAVARRRPTAHVGRQERTKAG
jgi:hypothetical protein